MFSKVELLTLKKSWVANVRLSNWNCDVILCNWFLQISLLENSKPHDVLRKIRIDLRVELVKHEIYLLQFKIEQGRFM